MESSKIHAIGCNLAGTRTGSIVEQISRLKSLAFPVVCLPDIHVKDRTEGPSSFAAATEGTLVPDLTAPSVGCGMAVVATHLVKDQANEKFFQDFFRAMRQELGPNYGISRNFLLMLGVIKRPRKRYDLTAAELESVLKDGAAAAVKKYGLPETILDKIEYRGSMFTEEEKAKVNLYDILPPISFRSGKHNLGYGFKGNHFIEIQYVEEILDEVAAGAAGLAKNQIVIMYHGGGGAVPYHVGRFYGNRKKNTPKKFFLLLMKLWFHLGSFEGLKNIRTRLRYYFWPRTFTEIPADFLEGKRILFAIKTALNYSYAFRVATVARIQDALQKTLGGEAAKLELITDIIHNSIVKENIKGKDVYVHRHTANRIFPGKLTIVSGYNNTSSYLALGLENTENTLFSADHGAGETIKRIHREGGSGAHPEKLKTYFYESSEMHKTEIAHITDEGIELILNHLQNEKVIKPVARLRPLAVFKG